MKFFIYKIINIINGKIYIGKTKDIKKRWKKHISCAKIKNNHDYTYLHRAINKYGAENFKIEIIEKYNSEEESLLAEIAFIKQFESTKKNIGYNLTDGGEGHSGHKHSLETREKLRLKQTGKKASIETKEKISKSHLGSKRSEETKRKMREARAKQVPMSEDTKKKISESRKALKIKLSNERKIQISLLSRGEKNKSAILKEKEVLQILQLKKDGYKRKYISKLFPQVKIYTIDNILYGNNWKHLK